MKRPEDEIATSRKSLPKRRSRKPAAGGARPSELEGRARRKRVLKRGSDLELVKTFGHK